MVTVDDVFYHMAQELRCYTDSDRTAAIDEFLCGSTFDFHLSITTDVEESELYHLENYGRGHTFYFRLSYIEHGLLLMQRLYKILMDKVPDMDECQQNKFGEDARLYLFVHVINLKPPAVEQLIDVHTGTVRTAAQRLSKARSA